tara:strand:+ start:910 stop:1950 length:1041 start_codon:yes stop_codon:yes gene_type:complete
LIEDIIKVKVSVVIPTQNRSNFLIKSVKSVLNQDYKNIEIIIVDDGSIDNTDKVVRDLKIKNINTVRSYKFKEKVGAAHARQKGVEISNGEYIAFLDDDDEWLSNKIELQIKALEKYKNLGAVTCWYQIINNDKKINVQIPDKLNNNHLYWGNMLGSFSLAVIKKEILINNKIIHKNLESCQDWDFWIQVLKYSSIGIIPKYLVEYNDQNRDRITLNQSKKVKGMRKFLEINQSMMNELQKEYILAKIYEYTAVNSFENRFNRYKSKIKSALTYHKLGHPNYATLLNFLYSIIKYLVPNKVKSLFIKSKNLSSTKIHNERDFIVAEKNLLNKSSLDNNQQKNIIYI